MQKLLLTFPIVSFIPSSMKIDLHCHSKYSHDNYLDPREVIAEALAKDLDGVCFTEHYFFEASKPVENLEVPDGFYVFGNVWINTGGPSYYRISVPLKLSTGMK